MKLFGRREFGVPREKLFLVEGGATRPADGGDGQVRWFQKQ